MLRDAAGAGYDVFLTNDRNQLNDPLECAEIKKSKLHHVRYGQRRQGLAGLGLALGAVIAAMPRVMEELEQANGQRLVHITGLDPNRRFELTDPARNPQKLAAVDAGARSMGLPGGGLSYLFHSRTTSTTTSTTTITATRTRPVGKAPVSLTVFTFFLRPPSIPGQQPGAQASPNAVVLLA